MANSIGDMVVKIVGDNSQFDKSINSSQQKMKAFGEAMTKVGRKLTLFVSAPILGIGVASIKAAADMQSMMVSFKTMLGSGEKAKTLLIDLKNLAAFTPFGLNDLSNATKTLLQFGIQLEDVMPTLETLGDISLGNSQRLQSLTLAFGQMTSAGRLMGQDLLQMINVGFNPLQVIAKQTGETMAELKDRMSKGAIGVDEVTAAFRSATAEGGQFFEGMKSASETLAGRFSTMKDSVVELARNFGSVLLPTIQKIVEGLTRFIDRFAGMSEGTKKAIITIGLIAAAVGPAMLIIGKGIKIIQGITKAVELFKIATEAARLVTLGMAAAAAVDTAAKVAGTTATVGMTLATQALAVAQLALPILAIIAAIVALTVVVVKAIKETRDLAEATEAANTAYKDQQDAMAENTSKIPGLLQAYDDLSTKQDRSIIENRELARLQRELGSLIPGIIDEWGINTKALKDYNDQMEEVNRVLRDESIAAQEDLRERLGKNAKWFAIMGASGFGSLVKVTAQIEALDESLDELNRENMQAIVDKAQEAEEAFREIELSASRGEEAVGGSAEELRNAVKTAELLVIENANIVAEMEKQKQIAEDIEALRIGFIAKAQADLDSIDAFVQLMSGEWAGALKTIGNTNRTLEDQKVIYDDLLARVKLSTEAEAFYHGVGNSGYKTRREAFIVEIEGLLKQLALLQELAGEEEERATITADRINQEAALERDAILLRIEQMQFEADERLRIENETKELALESKKAKDEAWVSLTSETVGVITNLITTLNAVELAGIEEVKNARLKALDKELQAELAKHGLEDKSRRDQIKEELKDLDGKLTEERKLELNDELQKLGITATYDALKAKAEEEAAADARRINRETAIAQRIGATFSIAMDTAKAIAASIVLSPLTGGLPWSLINAGLGLAQAAAVWVPPLPPLAEGGIIPAIPGGRAFQIAEAGQTEVVFPLDRLDEFLSNRNTGEDGEGNMTHLVVNMDSEPFLEAIFPATQNRTILLDQGALI